MESKYKIEILPEHVARAMGKNLESKQNPINPDRRDVFYYKKSNGGFAIVRDKNISSNLKKVGLKLAFKLHDDYQKIFEDRNLEFTTYTSCNNIKRVILKDVIIPTEISDFDFDIEWEKVVVKNNGKLENWLVSTHSVFEIENTIVSLFTNQTILEDNSHLFIPYFLTKSLDFKIKEEEKDKVFMLFNNPLLILSLSNEDFFKLIPYLKGLLIKAEESGEMSSIFHFSQIVEAVVKQKINEILNDGKTDDYEISKLVSSIISVMNNNTLSTKEREVFSKWLDEKLMGDQIGLYGHIDDFLYYQSEEDE